MKLDTKSKMFLIVLAIIFVVFNVLFFLITDLTSINGMAITSWFFMAAGFASFIVLMKLNFKKPGRSGLVLGLPILGHCCVYLICDFILAILFTILSSIFDIRWIWGFSAQLIALAVHWVIAILCLIAKETIENVGEKVQQKTSFMRLLRADAALLPELCNDSAVKVELKKFAEAVQYSDIVSDEALQSIEQKLADTVEEIKVLLSTGDNAAAKAKCDAATLILKERNLKCKALKKHS